MIDTGATIHVGGKIYVTEYDPRGFWRLWLGKDVIAIRPRRKELILALGLRKTL